MLKLKRTIDHSYLLVWAFLLLESPLCYNVCVPTIYPDTALQEVKQPSKKRSPDQADKKLILGKYRTLEEVPREVQI